MFCAVCPCPGRCLLSTSPICRAGSRRAGRQQTDRQGLPDFITGFFFFVFAFLPFYVYFFYFFLLFLLFLLLLLLFLFFFLLQE